MASATVLPKAPAATTSLYDHALRTASLELQYEHARQLVSTITSTEALRALRFDTHILQDDNDELRDLLAQEETRAETFEQLVTEHVQRADAAEARLAEVEEALRAREQDVGTLQAEAKALQTSAADSEAFLTEKLALTRELSILRPELAHCRAQAAAAETLLAEKLELQRQLTAAQCEVENARRDVKRAMAKRRNTGVEIAQEEQVEELKRQLAKEKRARLRLEEAAEATQADISVDEVRKELAREKRARQKAEEALEAAQENTQVEDVRRDLLKEKKAKQRLEESLEALQADLEKAQKQATRAAKRAEESNDSAATDEQLDELRQELAREKKERARLERSAQKAADEFEAQKSTLDDKLGQFRTKLKATKEKLKETEAELAAVRAAQSLAVPATKTAAAAQNTKKRAATQIDPDATNFGTPGDGPVAKRGRNKALFPAVGDKSTFSITPFLNRTLNATTATEDQNSDNDAGSDDEENVVASPSAAQAAARPNKKKKLPLAPVSASEANIPRKTSATTARARKPTTAPALAMVTEEEDAPASPPPAATEQENAAPAVQKIKTKLTDGPSDTTTTKQPKKPKMRKSLGDFATFTAEPAAEKMNSKQAQKKKRKLGGLGKTLFDEEEDDGTGKGDAGPTLKALPAGRTFFGAARLGLGMGKKGGLLGGGAKTAAAAAPALLSAPDGSGFQFSPLKKQRRNLDDTLRG